MKNEDRTKKQLLNELAELRQRIAELEKSESIRKQAEKTLQELPTENIQSHVHEMQTHQIELEMQNEELRRIQSELEEAHNKYADLYDFAPIGYFTFDKNGLIIDINLTGANMLGIEKYFLIRTPFFRYVALGSRDIFHQHFNRVFRTNTKQTCEIKLMNKNGSLFDAQLESLSVQNSVSSSNQCRTAIIDITEHRRAEQEIRQAHAYAESIVETLRESLVVMDAQQKVKTVNLTFYKTFKVTPEETINKFIFDIGNRQWNIPKLRKLLEEIIPKNTYFNDFEVDHEFPTIGRRTMLLNARQIHQIDTNKQLILLAIEDITDEKKLESQLLRSQRMESIGTLTGGIAHDLNNLMTPMMLSVEMLKQKFKDEQSQKLLTILEKNSQRGADLIKQVMSFARGVEGERNPLQAKHIISEIEKVLKETFPRNIEIRTDMQEDLWTTAGDTTQLHQVLMNLCVNARDAMKDGGILNISAENIFVDENYARMYAEAKVGSYVAIAVSDTGTGIPPKILDRIFEPFFTTKEFGKGTGLGLSTALAIVKSHGGFINVYSEVGNGTKFKVYLPAIKTKLQEAEEQKLEMPTGNEEFILVAEDEGSISEITCSTLEAYGYKVLMAKDGAEAVAVYAENIDKIKVVLMDLMMPVMDGQTSIRAIRKINPEIKIIAVSGLAEKDRLANIADNVEAFLPKPYTAEKLLKTIHEALSAK